MVALDVNVPNVDRIKGKTVEAASRGRKYLRVLAGNMVECSFVLTCNNRLTNQLQRRIVFVFLF